MGTDWGTWTGLALFMAPGCNWGYQIIQNQPEEQPEVTGESISLGGQGGGRGKSNGTDGGGARLNKSGLGGDPCAFDCDLDYPSSLVHRFAFKGTGNSASDSIGNGSGSLVNTELDGSGELDLDGITPPNQQYALLNRGLISDLTDATIEVWFTWHGGRDAQRVFDFGNSTAGAGQTGTGLSSVYLSPQGYDDMFGMRAAVSPGGGAQQIAVRNPNPMQIEVETHAAVVLDDTRNELELYVNGAFVGETPWYGHLSDIEDVNCWLGISQDERHPEFDGHIDELRIYNEALSTLEIRESYELGPDF